jgi:phenylacetate-CoA ligase
MTRHALHKREGARQRAYFSPDVEMMPRKQLQRLQFERLRRVLHYVYANVPHYRRKFEAAGITPFALRGVADLRHFPFTAKSDLRDTYPFGMFAVKQDALIRIHASSGTTGKPTVVGYTSTDLANWALLMARSLVCAGVHRGDIVHNAYGYGLFTGGLGVHDGAQRLGCTVVPASGGGTERQVTLMADFGATVLCATPSYALNIAEVAEHMGVDLRAGPLRVGVCGAEPWSEGLRQQLENRLGLAAIDIYGLSEIMGPGVAVECHEAQAGLHGWEDHFLFEVIDPDSGEPLEMGKTGELVITTLAKEALPMIRYRTRDITQLTDEPCRCGRTHLRIRRITGRSDDMLIVRGVNVYPSQIEAALVGLPQISPHYQLVIERKGALDQVRLEVEADPGVATEDAAASRAIAETVAHRLKSLLGVSCEVTVRLPGAVPRSQGKAVRVRDLRPKE